MHNPSHPQTRKHRCVFFGELLMRLSPPGHELPLQSPRMEVHFGGAEANVATSMAILGHDCAMVSALPDNVLGRACAGELRRHGVDTTHLHYAEGRMGLYFLSPGAMHRPSEVLYDRVDSVFARTGADAYDWSRLLADAQGLHLSGINLALGDATAQAALAAVQAAHKAGVPISFDCNFRSKLWGSRIEQAPALLSEIAAQADLIFGNDRDIALILGLDFPHADATDRFRAAGTAAFSAWPRLRRIAATGRHLHNVSDQALFGLMATRDRMLQTSTHALTGIVDRIGAGDAFAAGFLHGLARKMSDETTLDFAIAAACLKHAIPGDANLSCEADVLALMAQGGFEVKR
ncbi:MAG TPA: sugar kinase [Dyella sp.]|uniref:sugar kinase n=1 Tax=Dyella sp. TaxID=1869338 RepID=UPI002BE4B4FD|nr:sugar kinase [Dyella sp.]HTV84471.1 sugar kinase [Dyella sp.]